MKHLLILFLGIIAMTASAHAKPHETAIFAGGCFWCMEAELQELPGVISVVSGYTGGSTPQPTYENAGDHTEAVRVTYDPALISYDKLLESFWDNIDPTDAGGQFFDRGEHYHTAIFVNDDVQRKAAEASKSERQKRLSAPIVTPIKPAVTFYEAEEYHQDYYQKNPTHYNAYKAGSQRKETLKKVWGKKD